MIIYTLHGFTFWSAEERQQVAESHPLWQQFRDYWERRQGYPPDMNNNGCRERFEYFVEGAYREFMAESEEAERVADEQSDAQAFGDDVEQCECVNPPGVTVTIAPLFQEPNGLN